MSFKLAGQEQASAKIASEEDAAVKTMSQETESSKKQEALKEQKERIDVALSNRPKESVVKTSEVETDWILYGLISIIVIILVVGGYFVWTTYSDNKLTNKPNIEE